ncbi:MAG: hypothetical protein ACQGVC_09730 [Myxococcota bacterium]
MRTTKTSWIAAAVALCSLPLAGGAATPRERAVEQIPELMGRILESQEEIRERESELAPVVQEYDQRLVESKREIDSAGTDQEAVEALIDYVESYASRLEAQQEGLRSIESAVVRMRADARELERVADSAGRDQEPKEVRESFYQDQFQGVAAATSELAGRLDREDEAETAGAVLHASWASHGTLLELPLPELGPDGAAAFARKIEGLYARHQARSNQLRVERQSVRRLLDLLIERQLARRLDALFAGGDTGALGEVLSGEGRSASFQDLGGVVRRALDIPASAGGLARSSPSLDRLDYFARGGHRDRDAR